ncbi:acetylxylan esterase [Saccharothrix sp. MB29]|nr:acetylxylan esterase [Saccharothrix sp. MB29]
MPWFDLSERELAQYRTATAEPDNLDLWWKSRLEEARAAARPPVLSPYAADAYGPLPVWDVEFSGYGGDRVRGWYIRPGGAGDEPLPTVVCFIGYGGGRGLPSEHALLPAAGYAVFVMDTRGQGGRWTLGATADSGFAGPEHPGVMTRGIASPETYYVTRLMVDAARAVEVAAGLDGVDPARLAVSGGSQGGGLRWPRRRVRRGGPVCQAGAVPVRLPAGRHDHRRRAVRGGSRTPGAARGPDPRGRWTPCATSTARCCPAASPRRAC